MDIGYEETIYGGVFLFAKLQQNFMPRQLTVDPSCQIDRQTTEYMQSAFFNR
jgi:hypothetical protein